MKKANSLYVGIIFAVGMLIGWYIIRTLKNNSSGSMLTIISALVLLGFFFYTTWLFISSAKKVKVADSKLRREAVKFETHPDLAVLYISRPQTVSSAVPLPVVINDSINLWMKGKNFYRLELPAGSYTLSGNKKCKEKLILNLQAGEVTYVEQEVLLGVVASGYRYQIEDAITAQKGIAFCKLLLVPEAGSVN